MADPPDTGTKGDPMQISRYVHYRNTPSSVVLYHSLLLKKAILDHPTSEAVARGDLSQLASADLATLADGGFLTTTPSEDDRVWRESRRLRERATGLSTMFLVVADDCNMHCAYCYQVAEVTACTPRPRSCHRPTATSGLLYGEDPIHTARMSLGTVDKALRFLSRERRPGVPATLYFFGGEPLLNIQAIRHALDTVSRTAELRDLYVHLQTNGLLIDPEVAALLAKHRVDVCVSLDGPAEIHDDVRLTSDGQPTAQRVITGIRRLQDVGLKPTVACTVTKSNYDRLTEIANYVYGELGIDEIGFNVLMCKRSADEFVDSRVLLPHLIEAYEGLAARGVSDGKLSKIVGCFAEETLNLSECDILGRQIVVLPDGHCSPCLGSVGAEGPPRVPFPESMATFLSQDEVSPWTRECSLENPECQDCPGLGICGGGCLYARYLRCGDIRRRDAQHCRLVRGLLDWMLERVSRSAEADRG
jgi:uncharacterized protein